MTAPAPHRQRVVIVGAGHAAGRLAERLRHLGHQGEIVLIGAEAHPPYERPFLSKAMLVDEPAPQTPALLGAVPGVLHRGGCRAVGLDRARRLVQIDDTSQQPYDVLVLATGLRPRRLPVPKEVAGRTQCLHTLDDARTLRATLRQRQGSGIRLGLIGAGFVGLEVASSARQLGAEVDIVDVAPVPLLRAVPAAIGARIAQAHREQGSRLHLGRAISAIEASGNALSLRLEDGTAIEVDRLVFGMGGQPRDALAREAGIETADGILVDGSGRSSDPSVFAIGDVARRRGQPGAGHGMRLESWRNAEDSATIAAAAILGVQAPATAAVPSFWTDQLGLRIQFLGLPAPEAELWETGATLGQGYGALSIHQGRLCQAVFVAAPKVMRAARDIFRGDGRVDSAVIDALGLRRSGGAAPGQDAAA